MEKGHPKANWLRSLGLPPSLKLGPGILLLNWGQVHQRLCDLCQGSPVLEADAPPHAQIWRRLTVGKPGSQCSPHEGALPATPLAWGPPRRILKKQKPPQWLHEIHDAGRVVRWVLRHDLVRIRVGELTLLELLQNAGVASQAQLGHFARALTFQSMRSRRFLDHARTAKHKRYHISAVSESGVRPICAACSSPGPLTNSSRWLGLPCPRLGQGFDDAPIIASLERQISETDETLRLLARLR